MNTLNDLRESLERHANLAPDGLGLVGQAQAGAVRIRRRRRIIGAGAAAVVLLVVAAGLPAVLRRDASGPSVGAPTSTHTPAQSTVDIVAGSGVVVNSLSSVNMEQRAHVTADSAGSAGGTFRAVVHVLDPDSFDATALRRGKPTTVQGLDAWFQVDYPAGFGPKVSYSTERPLSERPHVMVLGWQDPSGTWVAVTPDADAVGHLPGRRTIDEKTKAGLTKVAEAVRIRAARDIPLPYRLSWLPAGARILVMSATRTKTPGEDVESHVELHGALTAPPDGAGDQVHIDTLPVPSAKWSQFRDQVGGKKTTVAGHPAWYVPTPPQGMPSSLILEIGNCGILIHVWRDAIPYADQERMVAGMTVGDCADPATWKP